MHRVFVDTIHGISLTSADGMKQTANIEKIEL